MICLKSRMGSMKTLQWRSQLESRVITINLVITMDLLLTEAYHNYRGFRKYRIILSVIPGNPLIWAFLMENFNLEIVKMSVISENPLFPNPLLPKTSV